MSKASRLRWIVVFAYYGLVLILLLSPAGCEPVAFPFADKLAHFLLFVILGALLQRACVDALRRAVFLFRKVVLWGIVLAGISELLQLYAPTRTADVRDFTIDLLGIVVGALFLTRVYKKRLQSRKGVP